MQAPSEHAGKKISGDLEDKVYLQMDKLAALCSMQVIADTNECQVPLDLRTNYSAVLEEHAFALRALLDEVFT